MKTHKEHFAGIITETDDGEFVFRYDENFVSVREHPQEFITFTMPVQGAGGYNKGGRTR